MSRLFDALAEASRLRQPAKRPGNGLLQALGIPDDRLEVSPAELEIPTPEAGDPIAQALGVPENPTPEAAELPEGVFEEAAPLVPVLPGGKAVAAAPDPRARLIPHAVNDSVMEQYRRLRTKINHERQKAEFRSLVVTSANPQEGKTVTSLNLALSFAMIPSFRVLVVDGDLRRSTMRDWLGVSHDQPGLSNFVDGSAGLGDVLLKAEQVPMHFMVSGTSTTSPAELLHSSRLQERLREISRHYDLVLIDSPPINAVSDAHLLAASSDAVLLVARSFVTTTASFTKAVQELQKWRIVGIVLNGGAGRFRQYKSYY